MSFVMTYDELKNRLRSVLQRQNDTLLSDNLDMIIDFGERRIARELKFLVSRKVVTGNLTIADPKLLKPARWLETISFSIGIGTGNNQRKQIFPRSAEFCKTYWPNLTQTGEPVYYADDNWDNWVVVPTALSAYPVEISYYERPEPLSSSNQTNIFTENVPDILFYACLLETPGILRTDERIPTWQTAYDRHLQAYNAEAKMRMTDAANNREAGV